jgi:hypothetical protein
MPLAPICILYCKQCNTMCMNIIYAGFPGLGFRVMFVFAIVYFMFFFEYQFVVDIVQGYNLQRSPDRNWQTYAAQHC